MKKTRRTIDAALRRRSSWEPVREHATVAESAQCYEVHPYQIYAWKKQLLENAARAFEAGVGLDAEKAAHKTVGDLYAKINRERVQRLMRTMGIGALGPVASFDALTIHGPTPAQRQALGLIRNSLAMVRNWLRSHRP